MKSLLGQKFRIGYYQRDYKWESKQVRELIEDLTNGFLLDYRSSHAQSRCPLSAALPWLGNHFEQGWRPLYR
ncbi:MAG: DUF262 domain-containing protein [Alphaproteobacteria bacterium]|nr:DUF262 domain-containing protein [Alphaproteobacteria bacterium]